MKKTTAIKQSRYISLCCPSFNQLSPKGKDSSAASLSAPGSWLLARLGFTEHTEKAMPSGG